MLESFHSSSVLAKVLNLTVCLFTLLIWISTIVFFGGEQFVVSTTSNPDPNTTDNTWIHFYWNKAYNSGGVTTYYSSSSWADFYNVYGGQPGGQCYVAGNMGFASAFFAFLPLMFILLPAIVCRIFGISLPIIGTSPDKSVAWEFITHCWVFWWMFLLVCVFGAECFQPFNSRSQINDEVNHSPTEFIKTTGTGFGYVIFSFLLCVFNVAIVALIKRDTSLQLGSGGEQQRAGGYENSTGQSVYQPQYDQESGPTAAGATEGGVYSAGSYQTAEGNNTL